MFEVFTFIVAVSALMTYINHKYLKLPTTIGVLILSIIFSLLLSGVQFIDETWYHKTCSIVTTLDFREVLFDFLLGFLLFAGAIHVNLNNLLKEKAPVIVLATVGVLLSTFITGSLIYLLASGLGVGIDYKICLVFGSLIAPTDPVAVLSLLEKAKIDKRLEIKVIGESLFNDGVGIVVFLSMLALAGGMTVHGDHEEVTGTSITMAFLIEAGGGLLLGFILGRIGIFFLKSLKNEPVIEVHITLGIVMAGYSLASLIGVSGALAMVIAGIMVGNRLSKPDMPDALKQNLNTFWNILDEVLNAILFVMIGIEILILDFNIDYLLLGMGAILIVLLSRYLSVFLSNKIVSKEHRSTGKEVIILTWAGLRGGISIALALNLTEDMTREPILYMTYIVVVFSIIVQGLTIGNLVKRIKP
jgi:CPA1 family monovalent cation:H+ antiporter